MVHVALFEATRVDGWWLLDVAANRERLVTPATQAERLELVRTICVCHDVEVLHFYRTPQNPKAVGIVVRSTSSRRIRLFSASYCEFESDDVMTGEAQATVTGVHSIYAYPPVLANATLCNVWVNTRGWSASRSRRQSSRTRS